MEEGQNGPTTVVNSKDSTKKGLNLWKFISIILIIILFGLLAFELGKGQISFPKMASTLPTVTKSPITPTVAKPSPAAMVSPSSAKTVSAGIKNQLFSPYTLSVPSGWTDDHTANTASDTLTITKGPYVITISQGAGGGGSCIYPGDAAIPLAQTFNNFVAISGAFSQFRRGTIDNTTYTVCEQKGSGFAFPTSVGYITYTVPTPADQAILTQMDGMVASITK